MKTTLPDNEKALWILKKKGPQSVAEIAGELDVTTEGARFHLLKLEKEGLVQSRSVSKGRGRPKQIWSLTDEGNTRFPDTHANLTANLLGLMQETLGEQAVDKVISRHEEKMLARYRQEIDMNAALENRISKLADIRTREGYMAEYEKADEGFLFIENHCPICVAATACQGFCRAELNTFRAILGDDVEVERTEHIVKGQRRCAYRIKE
ncbi:MAG: transcriptional regulator [Balneolaceae bacterium]|nr:transcriptional regulator [Balneolaceae bacterium]